MQYGLLGKKLGHSFSPAIHRLLGSSPYSLFEKTPEELGSFLKNGNFQGLNVTIPYKKAVIPYCDTLSPTAQKIGAVNTLIKCKDGTLMGHNTDYFGFSYLLHRSGLDVSGKKVLVLGSGGASVTVVKVLSEMHAKAIVISRSGQNNYGNLEQHTDAAVIVNTTPVGMYPETGCSPLSLSQFPCLEGVLDIIYNPARTKLLMDAEKRGLITGNGLWMLVAQAKESAEWFLQHKISDSKIHEIHHHLRMQTENIILIGMPGSGKSTVGAILAKKTGRSFVDADAEIEKAAGCPIPEIFSSQGENAFRKLESEVLAKLGKQSGLILATGGGCVTRSENYELLHQNGTIYQLDRDLEALATEGRPLSQNGGVRALFEKRMPLYHAFADFVIDNNGAPETAAEAIMHKENVL